MKEGSAISYYHDLTFHLRLRRLPESRILEILGEVHDRAEQSHQDPKAQFGPAADYAQQFPAGEKRSAATRLALVVLTAIIALFGLDVAHTLVTDTRLRIGPVRLSFVLFGLMSATMIAAVVAEHRLPAGFPGRGERDRSA